MCVCIYIYIYICMYIYIYICICIFSGHGCSHGDACRNSDATACHDGAVWYAQSPH